jgi:uncharacterized phage protein (TIGR01671 family)
MCHRGGGTEHLSGWLENPDVFAVMQYTGLKDKNGREIYEGDIVQQHKQKADPFHGRRGDVRFKAGTGCYGIFQGDTFASVLYAYEQIVKDCKVIGNIYETPELLEQAA